MSITVKDVKHIATLCRLNVPDDEMDMFVGQFNQILEYAEILKKVDTKGIEPSPYVLPISNVLRDDVPQTGGSHEEAMENAPEEYEGGFKVPRVIE